MGTNDSYELNQPQYCKLQSLLDWLEKKWKIELASLTLPADSGPFTASQTKFRSFKYKIAMKTILLVQDGRWEN